jgi:hypothetical protein
MNFQPHKNLKSCICGDLAFIWYDTEFKLFFTVIGFPEVPSRVACFEQSTVRNKISRIFTKEENTL